MPGVLAISRPVPGSRLRGPVDLDAVGVLAKSQGLVADGIHSLSDLVADFVVLFAGHHSKKDADEDHPYDHQRFETAAPPAR